MDFEIPDDVDLSQCPGLVEINSSTPNWKRDMIEKKNQERIEEYVKKILKEREQEAKWKNIPEWKKKILQKKEEEEGAGSSPVPETKASGKKSEKKTDIKKPETKADNKKPETQADSDKPETMVKLKKAVKKPPPPPPKDIKDDFSSHKPKGDIVPAALSIDPEELAAMPPWKRELLFKRDKVPVTFSNEFNPDEDSTADSNNTTS
ncbi:hypothetical protein BsWGS_03375 [Bradybaena similaris]